MTYLIIAICLTFTAGFFYISLIAVKEILNENKKLREFIDKNINERVVYTTQDVGYSNIDKLEEIKAPEPEPETIDLTPEMLYDIENNKPKEGE
jgi:hypothetical protein